MMKNKGILSDRHCITLSAQALAIIIILKHANSKLFIQRSDLSVDFSFHGDAEKTQLFRITNSSLVQLIKFVQPFRIPTALSVSRKAIQHIPNCYGLAQ